MINAMSEFDKGWDEFFKDKPEPESLEEHESQMAEFTKWYNTVRPQSDTGKTPEQMYAEGQSDRIYEESKDDVSSSAIMDFASALFDKNIWHKLKSECKDFSKRDTCREAFILGFITAIEIGSLPLDEEDDD